ncbi:MAG TPA: PilN domain-containing protein [Miltoncostaeaceae bacterium]|nr:PilN domain-containing protein [Miltoncostaeaceae bacterium]
MKAVNLLPQRERRTPGFAGAKTPLAVVGAVALLGGMGFWGYSLHGQVNDVKSDVATATAQRDALRDQLGAFQAAQARDAAQEVRTGAVVGLVTGRVNWERIIRDLTAVMPADVWLTNLKGETEVAATPTAATANAPNVNNSTVPRGIHLDGYAYTQDQVALLMARASTVPGLGEPRLATSEVQAGDVKDVIHFVIDIPIDQRAQDRSTLTPVNGAAATSTASGVTP